MNGDTSGLDGKEETSRWVIKSKLHLKSRLHGPFAIVQVLRIPCAG